MEDLTLLREEINEIDEKLVQLFLRRMEVVYRVADYKIKNSMNVLDRSREEQIINKHTEGIEDEIKREELRSFLEDLMEISRKAQKKIIDENSTCKISKESSKSYKVGFQGIAGSFSHEALLGYFGENVDTRNFLTFKEVFEAIKRDEIKYGIIPIENSSTGGIAEVYDLLGKYDFQITGEKCIEVEQNLLGIPEARIEEIEEVYSHSQGFLQCSDFLENHPNWRLIPYFNTAKSAEHVSKENNVHKGCIAGKKAAKFYGLKVLKEDINDSKNNYTRFIIVSKGKSYTSEYNKVSIVIALNHKAGTLYNALKYFSEYNLNMVKIESRPMADKSWQYFFYIDFIGNLLQKDTKDALENIKNESLYFKILGNYMSGVEY